MTAERMSVDVAQRKITFDNGNISPTFTARNKRQISINPKEEKLCLLESPVPLTPGTQCFVNPDGDLNADFQISPGLFSVSQHNILPVVLTNSSDLPQTFGAGEISAVFEIYNPKSDTLFSIDSLQADSPTPPNPNRPKISEKEVNLNQVPSSIKDRYLALLNKYSDVFSLNPNEVGKPPPFNSVLL